MKTKALQYFSDEYLESIKDLSSEDILLFLEDFRQLCEAVEIQKE